MASTYGIMTITELNNRINYDIKSTDPDGSSRLYSDEFIESIISDNELMVFGDLKQTYTLSDITNEVKFAIFRLSTIDMKWQLWEDGFIDKKPPYDAVSYWKDILFPTLSAERAEGMYVDAETVDDYELSS